MEESVGPYNVGSTLVLTCDIIGGEMGKWRRRREGLLMRRIMKCLNKVLFNSKGSVEDVFKIYFEGVFGTHQVIFS